MKYSGIEELKESTLGEELSILKNDSGEDSRLNVSEQDDQ
jgi:hypothetical protein